MRTLLEVQKLNFWFGGAPLWTQGLSFNLKQSQIVLITGPSGSGKSCIINALLNLCSLSNITGKIRMAENYSYLTTRNYLMDTETILENLHEYYSLYNLNADLDELLTYLKETENLNPRDLVSTLSFGTKRRLALYRTLNIRSDYCILDEPTTGFDIQKIKKFNYMVRQLASHKKAFLIVSHELTTAKYADKVVFIGSTPYVVSKNQSKNYLKVKASEARILDLATNRFGMNLRKVYVHEDNSCVLYEVSPNELKLAIETLSDSSYEHLKKASKSDLYQLVRFFNTPIRDDL